MINSPKDLRNSYLWCADFGCKQESNRKFYLQWSASTKNLKKMYRLLILNLRSAPTKILDGKQSILNPNLDRKIKFFFVMRMQIQFSERRIYLRKICVANAEIQIVRISKLLEWKSWSFSEDGDARTSLCLPTGNRSWTCVVSQIRRWISVHPRTTIINPAISSPTIVIKRTRT